MSLTIIGPFMSNPAASETGYDDVIHRVYYELCRGMEDACKARFAFYMWNYDDGSYSAYNPKAITDALIARGTTANDIDLKVLLDVDYYSEDSTMGNYENYRAYLKLYEAFGSRISLVKKSAMGLGSEATFAMHLKLITISEASFDNDCVVEELRGKKNVKYIVMLGSANIWGAQQYLWSNDAILFHGDKDFYDEVVTYWEQIQSEATPSSGHCEGFSATGRSDKVFGRVKWYNFPRKASDDVVESTLKNMQTSMDTIDSFWARTTLSETKTRARLAMSVFTNQRIKIAKELGSVDDYYHCDVKTVLRDHTGETEYATNVKPVEDELQSHGIPIEISPNPPDSENKIHNKLLTFQGRYPISGETKYRKLVWTGSHCYSGQALKVNAETLVRIESNDIYDIYKKYFDLLFSTDTSSSNTSAIVAVILGVIIGILVIMY